MIQQAHSSVQRRSTLADVLLRGAAQDPDRAALTFLADADTVKATLTYAEQEPVLCSETLAVLQYTSGSTAKPRGGDAHPRGMACDPPAFRWSLEAHDHERFLE
jgi:acyl-CoA synthetase (AMP-forming)/AMP-acid ligase II